MTTPHEGGPDIQRVAVFTGTRAEYGLLVPVLRQLQQSPRFDLKLIVAGAHLSLLHGMTIKAIEADGFHVDAKVEMLLASDTASAVTKSIGLSLIDLAIRIEEMAPALMIVLGDRYETLSAAVASVVAGVPVAHIHGGEVTEGAFDDSIRHAITKLSHLHFVATKEFGRRVAQMGEEAFRIHVVGAPAMDVIAGLAPVRRDELERLIGTRLGDSTVLVAYHPSTIPGEDPLETTRAVLAGVEAASPSTIVCNLPNADPQFAAVRGEVLEFVERVPNAVAIESLGHESYLSLLRYASCIVGNSSAGIIEAPVLGTPSVNVGQRQMGRPMAASVLSVGVSAADIEVACTQAMSLEFQKRAAECDSPYDLGVSVASGIMHTLLSTDMSSLTRKRFVDLPFRSAG